MARTRNTDKIQKRLKEEERQVIAAAGAKKAAKEEKAAAQEKIAAEEKKAADEKTESAEEEETAIEEEKEAEEEEEEEEAEQEEETAQENNNPESSARGDHTSHGSVSSRKRSASESSDELHYVPALKKQHKSWASFDAYLKAYEKRTSTVLVITETLNVRLRNERMKKQKRYLNKPDSEIPWCPKIWTPFSESTFALTVGNNDRARLGCGRFGA